jgi:hypothetical protein
MFFQSLLSANRLTRMKKSGSRNHGLTDSLHVVFQLGKDDQRLLYLPAYRFLYTFH